jgi:hypothetical protein
MGQVIALKPFQTARAAVREKTHIGFIKSINYDTRTVDISTAPGELTSTRYVIAPYIALACQLQVGDKVSYHVDKRPNPLSKNNVFPQITDIHKVDEGGNRLSLLQHLRHS